ncbi:MAG: hypothetical protein RLZZ484_1072, partial [Pseudomonadota bacterium]
SSVAVDLPFIGTGLANTGSLIANLRSGLLQDLREKLSGEGKPVELIREEMFKVFNGLGILQDQDGVEGITEDDISVGFYGVKGNLVSIWRPGRPLPTGGVDSIRFDMNLGGRILSTGLDLPLNIDLPGFALDVDGGFSLAADWQYDFGFGLSVSKGFFLDTNTGAEANLPELRMNVAAFLDGDPKDTDTVTAFEGRGKLLFFEAAVVDHDTDLTKPGFQGSGLRGALNIDLKGNDAGQLTLDQVLSSPESAFKADFGVKANLDLGVELSALSMPKLKSDLVINWDWRLGDAAVKFPEISIQNLRLDMQSAVADFLLPIATAVSNVAAPFRDIVTALTAPMPDLGLLLDPPRKILGLASDNTLRGFIDTVNELTMKAKPSLGLQHIDWSFLDAVKFALDMPEAIKSLLAFGAGLPLGSIYGLGTDNVRFVKGDGTSASNTSSNTALLKAIAGITAQASGGSSTQTERSGLQFMPYLTDIGNWAKIFSGGNATLFTYELPMLEFELKFNEILASVPIPFPPLSWLSIDIGAVGSVSAFVDLSFGFDTFGIQKAIASKNVFDVADGFYVNDWTMPAFKNGQVVPGTGGKEKPEFGIKLEAGLLGGLGITGVGSAGVGGSIALLVTADMNDIKTGKVTRDANGQVIDVNYVGDGKVRASEVLGMMMYPGLIPGIPGGPFNLFDLTFQSSLSPYIWGKTALTGTMTFKLFELKLPPLTLTAPTVKPVLASLNKSTGVLTLNMGARATDRLYLTTDDVAENVILSGTSAGAVDVEFAGFLGRYTGVTQVVVDMGKGNDTLDASRLLNNVYLDVRGGEGDDTLMLGAGGGRAVDLLGNNTLRALATGTKAVTFITGEGDDKMFGGLGDDVFYAGTGTNQITGGAGKDTLYAVAGLNRLTGGEGVDRYVFVGELGSNTLIETGTDLSDLDFSGMIPDEILKVIGPAAGAPAVSIPAQFNAARDEKSRIVFTGTPFTGDLSNPMTVTLSAQDGVFTAVSGGDVIVSGSDSARTFTGTIANLNKFFTNPENLSYTFTSAEAERTITVMAMQAGLTSVATAKVTAVDAFTPDGGLNQAWADLAVQGNLMVAVSGVSGSQMGIYVSRDGGVNWAPAQATSDGAQVQGSAASAGLVGSGQGTLNLFDGSLDTAYVNTSIANPGRIFTLKAADVLKGLTFTSAADSPESDPTRFALYGSNELLSWGDAGWSQIAQGATQLPETRNASSSVSFDNNRSFKYYKLVYTELRPVMVSAQASPGAVMPGGEGVEKAIDGSLSSKYLNRNKVDAGLLITLSSESVVQSLTLTTGNDAADRDPMRYVLLGANSELEWADASWTQIATGQTGLSTARKSANTVSFENSQSFKYYKLVLTDLRNAPTAYGMQVTEVKLGSALNSDFKAGSVGQIGAMKLASATNADVKFMDIESASPGLLFNLQQADVLRGLNFTSNANAPESDPTRYALLGSNDDLGWDAAGWTLVSAGATGLTDARGVTSHVTFANSQSFMYYKLVYTEQRAVMVSAVASPGAITPSGEGVEKAIDGRNDSKYLNRNKLDAGLLMTLSSAAVVDSLTLTTGNDAADRDPMRYELLGSNFELGWADAGWTPIANGQTGLSTDRKASNTVGFANTQSFKYYKLVLTDLRNAATAYGMQVTEVRLGNALNTRFAASETVKLAELGLTLAQSDVASPGAVPFSSDTAAALDADKGTKYVNPSKAGSGLMTALQEPKVLNRIDFTSANNDAGGDPTKFVLYGSTSPQAWDSTSWKVVTSGTTGLSTDRGATSSVSFANTQSFQYYKLVFTELRSADAAAMQIAGVYFDSTLPLGQGFDHVAISPDGRQIAALSNLGMVAISRDTGVTWTLVAAPADDYTDVLVTNEGRVILADRAGSESYSYKNFLGITLWDTRDTPGSLRELAADGKSWVTLNLPSQNWQDVVLADDGKAILGVTSKASNGAGSGAIYMGVMGTLVNAVTASSSNTGSGEVAANVSDANTGTKYLNKDKAGSGLVFSLSQADVVTSLQFTSANDASGRDPMTFTVFGSNDSADWNSSSWKQVAQGNTGLSTTRKAEAQVATFDNSTAYKFYKVVMTSLRDPKADAMQVSEIKLGASGGRVIPTGLGQNGIAWTDVTRGVLNNADWLSVDMDASGKRWAASTKSGQIFFADTTQAGWKWQLVGTLGQDTRVSISADGSALVAIGSGANGGVWVSSDLGKNWVRAAGRGEMGVAAGSSWVGAAIDGKSGMVTAVAKDNAVLRFEAPSPSAATNLILPDVLMVAGEENTPLTFPLGSLYDADLLKTAVAGDNTPVVSVQFDVTQGGFGVSGADAARWGVNFNSTAAGVKLTGTVAKLSGFLAEAGNLQFVPREAGIEGPLVVTLSDGTNTTVREIPLVVQKPVALKASYNAGNFEILSTGGNALRLSRSPLEEVKLGLLSDELTVVRLSDVPLVVRASEGADETILTLGNTLAADGLPRSLSLKDLEASTAASSQLSDDTLTLQFKPLEKSTTKNVVTLSNGQALSGIEKIVWDETLGTVHLVGDVIVIKAQGTGPIDLGDTRLVVDAKRLVIEGDLRVKDASLLKLNVSESVTLAALKQYGINGGLDTNLSVQNVLSKDANGNALAQVIQAVKIAIPESGGAVDLTAFASEGSGLQVAPEAGVAISLGAGGAGGLALDPSKLSNIPSLVIGSSGSSNPVSMGGAGATLNVSVPLVIQSQGTGGKVAVSGTVK